jgi:squalene/oxidosqualene cyclase-like protein
MSAPTTTPTEAASLHDAARLATKRAVENLARLQGDDGAWPGDYGGPMFLLPMHVALCHVAGRVPRGAQRDGMIAHLTAAQQADGSVGLHTQDTHPSMFCTVLSYVALRILGVSADDARLVRMRRFIRSHGTPLGAASWGKLTLCLLGLYDWEGIPPVLPELWLLPYASPFHPGRLWCHCRQVYLPMAWLYGSRATHPADDLVRALREELYDGDYARIDWRAHRATLASCDSYRRPSPLLDAANKAMGAFEQAVPRRLRARALASVREHIAYEDDVTDFIDIGPVNKVLNAFVYFFEDPHGERFQRAFARAEEYLYDGYDGTKMQGYNSSKLWDAAFAIQAVLATRKDADHSELLERAYGYVRDNQILDDVPDHERYFRHASRGGWPFSNRAHGWPITDCTAEGLKCALALEGRYRQEIPASLLLDSVELLLGWQNEDGGFATYERKRGGAWLELLNPSQVFGDIMVDYSYVECTSACLQALARAKKRFPDDPSLTRRISHAIARGAAFLRGAQHADGSFEGSWAVCFTYGTWFGVSGLLTAGAPTDDPAIRRACTFLIEKQRDDGGWGEHGDSCRERRWIPSADAGMAQTSWALSTLVRARHPDTAAQSRAAQLLIRRQQPDGSWAREPLVGVFNKTCLIDYENYRHYFPLWALAEWSSS